MSGHYTTVSDVHLTETKGVNLYCLGNLEQCREKKGLHAHFYALLKMNFWPFNHFIHINLLCQWFVKKKKEVGELTV